METELGSVSSGLGGIERLSIAHASRAWIRVWPSLKEGVERSRFRRKPAPDPKRQSGPGMSHRVSEDSPSCSLRLLLSSG
jgi:hypothetical protein